MQQWIRKGATITQEGRQYVVLELAELDLILAEDVETSKKVLLNLATLGAPREIGRQHPKPKREIDLLNVSDGFDHF
jgi:putative transposase